MSARPTFIDLFSGAGGLSWGLEAAGWQPTLALDAWSDAIETYRRSFDRDTHRAECVDIHEVDAAYLARRLEGVPDWVVGGPPCQGFSTVGKRHWDDDRNELFVEFMRIVKLLRPSHFLIENVLGLRDMGAQHAVRELFAGLGYTMSFHVLRAADYGVPQLRRRVFFIASREGQPPAAPTSTCSPDSYVTVWDAIGDLPGLSAGETATAYTSEPFTDYQRELRGASRVLQGHTVSAHPPELVEAISHIPDGGNRRSIPDRLQPRSGFHNSYSRLASWRPAVAVTSNLGKPSATRCIHPFQHRGLTAREGARLQSFPDAFHFSGGIVSQRLQIANAVPPKLAEEVGRALVGGVAGVPASAVSDLAAAA
ncbi:MAG TPA: DNA cytosine methyltransferase [Thermoleophilaceae bacterium]